MLDSSETVLGTIATIAFRPMFKKILIANRGEIAVRVMRTCREMGIRTVAVYSDVDRVALHVQMADEAYRVGPAAASESYLRIDRILEIAARAGVDAIHPGYGFLSENGDFAEACERANVKFIGPGVAAIRQMGSKTEAREMMQAAGVPVVPGTASAVTDVDEALTTAGQVGYPVMLKAAAGGGGKGMRLVDNADALPAALEQAKGEARQAFGDDAVYIEKAIVKPRHIEVQVLADEHGNVIHLGERECSLQRRHQKVIEETPSPLVEANPSVRGALCDAAVKAARACGYSSTGTVEFLMDSDCNFYFLEMNTRLQVEHPVTELVTGIDLVREQILIAGGERLRYSQDDIRPRGHAIECRVYAEDPYAGFMPAPGKITALREPSGPGVRVDSGVFEGWDVPLDYDPMIAKLAAWAPTRDEAIAKLRSAVGEYHIGGIRTTLEFFREILGDEAFIAGDIDTGFIARWMETRRDTPEPELRSGEMAAILAALVYDRDDSLKPAPRRICAPSRWKTRRLSKRLQSFGAPG